MTGTAQAREVTAADPTPDTEPIPAPHAASREFLDLALDHGWSASYVHGEDTADHPFISITAARGDTERVRITWHTRESGTYRLFSCLVGGRGAERDSTLTKAKATITQAPGIAR